MYKDKNGKLQACITSDADYFVWVCHKCGHNDNRNTDWHCQKCKAQIRCESAGGCSFKEGVTHCNNGCGENRSGQTDLSQRRADY